MPCPFCPPRGSAMGVQSIRTRLISLEMMEKSAPGDQNRRWDGLDLLILENHVLLIDECRLILMEAKSSNGFGAR